ncbi:MAG TPA: hypothetical protein VMN37_05735 [Gemmatimonadales bacterium]|nr:hypothetical protein [Gemmatimonadales bacterium]
MICPPSSEAQYEGRSFTVKATPATASVGDTVRLAFRLVMHERDLLTDTLPRPVGELPEGMRVYSVAKLRRGADRVFTGEALVAFYRPGVREIPGFGLPWVQIVSGRRGTLTSETATVDIVAVLPAGNPTLRDIREMEPAGGPGPLPLFAAGAVLAAAAAVLVQRRRRHAVRPAQAAAAPPLPTMLPDPYRLALERLETVERQRGAERGEVAAHYQAVSDTLRDYLEAAEAIPARERTTTELLWALPPRLTEGGLRRLAGQVLDEADLVKFARSRPAAEAAADHLREARELLRRWHEAAASARDADALR